VNISLSPPLKITTVADLVHHLDDIPLERIRMTPLPGTATEEDVIAVRDQENRLCELVDGVLVEKTVGYFESHLAVVLVAILQDFVHEHDLGIVLGADGTMKLMPGLVRIPDVSFLSWAKFPGRLLPAEPIPDVAPDLAIEVLSKSNTAKEMQRKLREYFEAGVKQVWLVDGDKRQVCIFTGEVKSRLYNETHAIKGGKLLPGFSLKVKDLFDRAGQRR
jgi:Uma2 family endonuclease